VPALLRRFSRQEGGRLFPKPFLVDGGVLAVLFQGEKPLVDLFQNLGFIFGHCYPVIFRLFDVT